MADALAKDIVVLASSNYRRADLPIDLLHFNLHTFDLAAPDDAVRQIAAQVDAAA